ncbi:enoyl-CoA hydratase/isomerase family protein [Burkholderia cenocepacia]|uniref:enoyl-CoA hydratase/isomerase family protein n=1 Tax=Burkholderia cenocepacia TaxID=95486 RepID=UPI001CF20743|nr:enoyl-CoA hydratase/isomerase family protein [Burkholderia cenocepacia]MCA8010406.1 enoyl-CoA hydratase/isomerase family protein [Burkholderia cenocepacia]
MPDQEVLIERHATVAVVTLNRPHRRNAWTRAMRKTLADVFSELNADDAVKAIVVTGAGDRAFCAGQDFTESQHFDGEEDTRLWLREIRDFYDLIRRIEKPTVAALNGTAAGSGFQFALLFDFRIGHAGVKMGQPEINSGIPSVVGPWVMAGRMPLPHIVDLALTGRLIDSDESERLGLLNKIVPGPDVLSTSIALAETLGAKPSVALRYTKRAFRQNSQAAFDLAFDIAEEAQVAAFSSGEPQRCMEKFLLSREQRKVGDAGQDESQMH